MNEAFIECPRSFCALGGAVLAAGAIPDAVPIIHASMGCGGSIYWNQLGSTGYLGAGYCGGTAIPSSNVQEEDIIFGGDARLTEQIENTIKLVEGNLYVVLTGCMTDIIGDDVRAIVNQFASRGTRIISAETGGIKGNGYKGYDLLLQALFQDFVQKNPHKVRKRVNLWGIVPGQDAFWRGNLNTLRELLEKLGLEVNTFFTQHDTLEGIRNAASAELNILVSEFYGTAAAKIFEEVHNVPFITLPLPIGPSATADFLRAVALNLGIDPEEVNSLVLKEQSDYYYYVERVADSYNDLDLQRYAVVVGDGNYAPALTKFLADDLGWLPALTIVTEDFADEDKAKIDAYLSKLNSGYHTRIAYETDASEIPAILARFWPRNRGQAFYDSFSPAFVIGSHLEREFAKKIGAGHLTVTYPVGNRVVLNRGYAGYRGSLHLIEDLFSVLVAER